MAKLIGRAEWIIKWLKKRGTHRTCNYGRTLICPKNPEMATDVAAAGQTKFCPLCGTELGKRQKREEDKEGTGNFIWKK